MPSNGQETKSIKLVLDTNVLISVLLFGKKLGFIMHLIEDETITPCFTKSTFFELVTVLRYIQIQYHSARPFICPQTACYRG